jgi:hypothetical protein
MARARSSSPSGPNPWHRAFAHTQESGAVRSTPHPTQSNCVPQWAQAQQQAQRPRSCSLESRTPGSQRALAGRSERRPASSVQAVRLLGPARPSHTPAAPSPAARARTDGVRQQWPTGDSRSLAPLSLRSAPPSRGCPGNQNDALFVNASARTGNDSAHQGLVYTAPGTASPSLRPLAVLSLARLAATSW